MLELNFKNELYDRSGMSQTKERKFNHALPWLYAYRSSIMDLKMSNSPWGNTNTHVKSVAHTAM